MNLILVEVISLKISKSYLARIQLKIKYMSKNIINKMSDL